MIHHFPLNVLVHWTLHWSVTDLLKIIRYYCILDSCILVPSWCVTIHEILPKKEEETRMKRKDFKTENNFSSGNLQLFFLCTWGWQRAPLSYMIRKNNLAFGKYIYEYMKDYMNCGERYEDMIDHRSYTHNSSSCEMKAWK